MWRSLRQAIFGSKESTVQVLLEVSSGLNKFTLAGLRLTMLRPGQREGVGRQPSEGPGITDLADTTIS